MQDAGLRQSVAAAPLFADWREMPDACGTALGLDRTRAADPHDHGHPDWDR
jgi:elongation factor P--beta-lysine ligase